MKSHMGFRLVTKSVTFNDLERRNGRNLAFFSAFGANYVKVVEDSLYFLRQKCSSKNVVFSDISFMVIFAKVTENECIIEKHLRDIHPLRDSLSLA